MYSSGKSMISNIIRNILGKENVYVIPKSTYNKKCVINLDDGCHVNEKFKLYQKEMWNAICPLANILKN